MKKYRQSCGLQCNAELMATWYFPQSIWKSTRCLAVMASHGSPVGRPYRASWSMKLSEGNIWNTWGSWTSTWQMEPVFGMFLDEIWDKNHTDNSLLKTYIIKWQWRNMKICVFTLDLKKPAVELTRLSWDIQQTIVNSSVRLLLQPLTLTQSMRSCLTLSNVF